MLEIDRRDCTGCSACFNACPKDAIRMIEDGEGFFYPEIDPDKCIKCGLCNKVCPIISPRGDLNQISDIEVYAAKNKSVDILNNSSSGGIFWAIATGIIGKGGIVFGAGFDENMKVIHKEASNYADLKGLTGSKYVQSEIGSVYKTVKTYLENNKKVFFTGTPCQVAGLYGFLQKDYENLLTGDLVCHGVPSPKVWRLYLKFLENTYGSQICDVSFRDKVTGWKFYSLTSRFRNSCKYSKSLKEDPFLIGFLRNIYLRPSCHACPFACLPRIGDITMADFWGIGNHRPELDDNTGTSLILINSQKGKSEFADFSKNLNVYPCTLEEALSSNRSLKEPVRPYARRKHFFNELDTVSFDRIIKKYMTPPGFITRCYYKLRTVAARIKFIRYFLKLMK